MSVDRGPMFRSTLGGKSFIMADYSQLELRILASRQVATGDFWGAALDVLRRTCRNASWGPGEKIKTGVDGILWTIEISTKRQAKQGKQSSFWSYFVFEGYPSKPAGMLELLSGRNFWTEPDLKCFQVRFPCQNMREHKAKLGIRRLWGHASLVPPDDKGVKTADSSWVSAALGLWRRTSWRVATTIQRRQKLGLWPFRGVTTYVKKWWNWLPSHLVVFLLA